MMVRRPAVHGSEVFRRAVLADMRHIAAHFPTSHTAERIAQVEAGAAVTVSAGRLFRGLHRLRATDVADLFRYDPAHGERWFELDENDVLTEM